MKTFIRFVVLSVAFACNFNAAASELVIEDTSGIIRHVYEVRNSALIKFTVTDADGRPIDGAVINLTDKSSGAKRQALSVAGVVEFLDVAPGQWVVSTETSNLLFTSIDSAEFGSDVAMASAEAQAATGASAGTGGGAASGAVVAGGVAAGAGTLSTAALVTGGVLVVGGTTVAVSESNSSGNNDEMPLSPFQ